MTPRDRPWMIRTYSGHSSARASNELYRTNLAKGQTGLSVAFDLPTQTGYDPDDSIARGEVGKVGVPVPHLGEMHTLFDGIPLDEMNTSMTINATAMWLLGMYLALADEQGVPHGALGGTTQNDILKEYLSRGTYIFPPDASRRLTVDVIAYAVRNVPKWNPINVCPYHLQEAGATPVQEVAYGLANAIAVLDAVRESGQVPDDEFDEVVGRISFFIDAGVRFVEETCKMRAFTELWDRITRERYGVRDEKLRRFRYGMQVNSLGLTEAQPENNVQRIVLEMLGVTLSKSARARAIQLPCWNEALGLPTPWDQQWSLRIQQVLAYESDLLEYDDLFEGSKVIEAKTREIADAAEAELQWVLDGGGSFEMIDEIKGRLVQSHAERVRRIESGDLVVVGVNSFTETEPSPLGASAQRGGIVTIDPEAEREQVEAIGRWREARDAQAFDAALARVRETAATNENLLPATIALAKAGGTVGEWAGALREVFGEYRAPTGVGAVAATVNDDLRQVRDRIQRSGRSVRLLVGKPGLDGHSNGAEQIAVAARDAGMEVVYQGIRLTPDQIAAAARDEDVDVVGLSILSGSHLDLVPATIRSLRAAGVAVPVVVGGIIPEADRAALAAAGVARVYTPKDFQLGRIMAEVAELALGGDSGDSDPQGGAPTGR
ncbi:MAG TPA: methylmalonyl-CoA mutase family protein [Acidimicrobiia bacterium]|nr:methylmalonyl-CoA mutase family protein [Acidimicrobiia bacterium]